MLNRIFAGILFLSTFFCFSQNEASVWYFGENAGIKFHADGSVTPLVDGQLNTLEGCATLSDSNGDLMFYTDGVTVYNKNHQIMLNGTGLKGHLSSTQSATIIQKPGSSNLFYVFTVDAVAKVNGLMYSEIDINLDGGLGGITAVKNIPIYSPTCEKLSVVKHTNNIDFWIITHGWGSNRFYAHQVNSSGISTTPTVSNSGIIVGTSSDIYETQGYMKISPNGKKLALCHQFSNSVELFDFDTSTGIVSNPKFINNKGQSYGVEFSPNSEVLYVSLQIGSLIYQYDLNSSNIALSEKLIVNAPTFLGALQLGPNNKIYIANYKSADLGVINDPNVLGFGCNLETSSVKLAGRKSMLGLPAFNQSFFNPSFGVKDLCLGETTKFTLSSTIPVSSAIWDFGDGTSSTDISPTHIYLTDGIFTVSVTATGPDGSTTKTKDILISKVPTATKPNDLLVCDDNNDGIYILDLTTQNSGILNRQDPDLYGINYFVNGTAIALPNSYVNLTAYGKQVITAEVYNKANGDCKSSTSFSIDVFDTPKPNLPANIPNLNDCDNTTFGSDTDKRIVFDLTQREVFILNGQSSAQFLVSYYRDAACTQQITLPKNYQNSNATETIFVKVINKDNADCASYTSFGLEVFSLPVVANVVSLKQCDDDIDGFSLFNLEEAIVKITANNSAAETITFHRTLVEAQNNSNIILNQTAYRNHTVSTDKVYVRIENNNNCYRTVELNLIVSTTQIPSTYSKTLVQCDDAVSGTNKDGIATFDLTGLTNEIENIFPAGQLLDITYYQNVQDALAEKNAITVISNYRNVSSPNAQKIFIRVDNRLNNDCLGLGGYITLKVEPIPEVQSIKKAHCDDNQDGLYAFDTSNLEQELLNGLINVTVSYIDQNNNQLPSPLPNPFVTSSQVVKVIIANNTPTACSSNSTITFIVDDLPEVFAIDPALTTVCDDEPDPVMQDGKYAFNTSYFEAALLGQQTGMTVNYYDSANAPLPSPLPNPFITSSQNVKVEVVNPSNSTCTASTVVAFVINPVPKINLNGEELVCSNLPTFTKQIDAGLLDPSLIDDYNYQWFFNGTLIPDEANYSLIINKEGIFTAEVTDKLTQCARTRIIKVAASDIASNIIAVVDESNTISISVRGDGNYVYALDDQNGYYQAENTFLNVRAGIHTVYIKDENGCGTVPKEVAVFGIPAFFTPNQDTYNDYWNIEGIDEASNTKTTIQIFDRYGKLLKQISPTTQGWDGTYLGANMPADDYWYVIKLEDNRVFKGHFALKR